MNLVKTLVLAEKPSVARDLARALGAEREGPFFRKGNLLVAHALGHLLEVAEDLAPRPWRREDLPILPERFRYAPRGKAQEELLKAIGQALKGAEAVVIATDAGREGELIARLVLLHLGWRDWERTFRLWTSEALTPEVVRREMGRLRPAREFESLFYAALARQHADWLLGVNLSRALTLQAGQGGVWSVGRVQTPVLRLVVEREEAIEAFEPEPFLRVRARFLGRGFGYTGLLQKGGETRLSEEVGEEVYRRLSGAKAGRVLSVRREEGAVPPPPLHSLPSLQRRANALYGMSAKRVLDAAQRLYEERKCISYPRTESRHLPESARGLVKEVLEKLGRKDLASRVDGVGKRVFDDKRLTDHHALIPLAPLPPEATPEEAKVYGLIAGRFLAAFSGEARVERTEVETVLEGEVFISRFRAVLEAGWTAEEPGLKGEEEEAEGRFPLGEGEGVEVEGLELERGQTEPPPRYTEGTLVREMERLGLGTAATRAEVLETLKERGYVVPKGKALVPTEKGKTLVALLRDRPVADPGTTARWEEALEAIWRERRGKEGYRAFLEGIRALAREETLALLAKEVAYREAPLGTCGCGKPVRPFKGGWRCEEGHRVYAEVFGKRLTEKQALALLQGKEVLVRGLKGKSGKPFEAYLALREGRVRVARFRERGGARGPAGGGRRR